MAVGERPRACNDRNRRIRNRTYGGVRGRREQSRLLLDELKGTNILANSMCPGWVKTSMGGPGATRSLERGADAAVWLATLPDGGSTGKFFRDRKEIPW